MKTHVRALVVAERIMKGRPSGYVRLIIDTDIDYTELQAGIIKADGTKEKPHYTEVFRSQP